MSPTLKTVLAVVAGIIIGSVVNMGIITIGPSIIPTPEGVDVTSVESLKENIHLYEAKHFITPFLAHALGTLVGAITAGFIATTHKMKIALGIGVFFLIGGIWSAFLIPAPTGFIILDLVAAYIPMGWLGGKWASNNVN